MSWRSSRIAKPASNFGKFAKHAPAAAKFCLAGDTKRGKFIMGSSTPSAHSGSSAKSLRTKALYEEQVIANRNSSSAPQTMAKEDLTSEF